MTCDSGAKQRPIAITDRITGSPVFFKAFVKPVQLNNRSTQYPTQCLEARMDRITQTAPLSQPAGRRTGFTLIELLVVISIIALLVGILLPALGAARRTAQNSQCLSNIRQMDTAAMSFAADHRFHVQISSTDQNWGSFPPELRGKVAGFIDATGATVPRRIKDWAGALVPYMGGDPKEGFENSDPKVSTAFLCPSDPNQDSEDPGYLVPNNITDPTKRKPISYGVNADATTFSDKGNTFWGWGATITPYKGDVTNGSLDEVKSTSNVMMFADCGTRNLLNPGVQWVIKGDALFYTATTALFPSADDSIAGTLRVVYEHSTAKSKIPISDNEGGANAEGPADRHSDKINVAFADGHAASVGVDGFDGVYLSPHK
jgi:prepilin-type N-terminal cleavage/methylation domain-containing protein/prepilin-type processing-associated H-X9-DG protein